MRLFINSGSPFARKCRILVREMRLTDRVEDVPTVTLDSVPAHVAVNPFAQVPALVTDHGAFVDSTLICEWLAAHYGPYPLYPEGEAQWAARQAEALADGILETAVKMVIEHRRPEAERSPAWLKRWEEGLRRALKAADGLGGVSEAPPGLAEITLASAATYIDFRFPQLDWHAEAPRLVALRDQLEKRQSFIDTYPS